MTISEIIETYIDLLKLSFQWSGRFSRRQFLFISIGSTLISFLIGLLLFSLGLIIFSSMYFWGVGEIIFFIPFVGTNIRRLHDLDLSGWWCLLVPVPIAGFAFLSYLILQKGKEIGKTRWG